MSKSATETEPWPQQASARDLHTIGDAEPVRSLVSSAGSSDADGSDRLPDLGTVFVSRYELTRVIGQGGFGAVYAATDRLTGQTVAIKILRRGLGGDLEGIRRETTVLRLLRLPGAALLLDEGIEGPWPFLVMEFAEGSPFPGARRRLSWDELREPTLALLEVLARVHAHGVLHRDLKPANVLVDAAGRVTVVDFGLSRARDDLRRDPALAGTPAYMAPEQIDPHGADARTDLYAVGTMVFEALAGTRPYDAPTSQELLSLKRQAPPRSLADFAPDAPAHVVAAVQAMLEPRRTDRPRSAAAALALLRGEPLRDLITDLVAACDGTCPRETMQTWFRGPERYLRLCSDAASELWRRTAGDPGRVEDELRAWVRAGSAHLDDDRLSVPRAQRERLRAGAFVAAREGDDETTGECTDELLAWAELAWPSADVDVLATACGADVEQVRDAIEQAIDAGRAIRDSHDRIAVSAHTSVLATWAPDQRRHAHAALADALPSGARGRLLHLAQTGSLDDVLFEAVAAAERSISEGATDEAVAAVEEGVRLLRLLPGHAAAAPLLTLLTRVAMLQGGEGAANMALYHLEHSAFDAPHVDDLRGLVRAVWLQLRGDDERSEAALRALGPSDDDELEWWRVVMISQCANHGSVERHEQTIDELQRTCIEGRPYLADLAHHMVARLRYRQGRFEESALAYEQCAELRPQPTRCLSARLNAASAWMEAGRFERAVELARQARTAAAAVRHAVFEARADWIERASQYRQGVDLPPDPEIVAGALAIGVPWLAALLLQTEAAFAWRAGDIDAAIAWATVAAGGSIEQNGIIAPLCDAFVRYLGGAPLGTESRDFDEAIGRITSPAFAEQIAWLLWQATGEPRWRDRCVALHRAIDGRATGVRGELLERELDARVGVPG